MKIKQSRQEMHSKTQLIISSIGATELLMKLEEIYDIPVDLAGIVKRLRLYKTYEEWVKNTQRAFTLNNKLFHFYTEWVSLRKYIPKVNLYRFPSDKEIESNPKLLEKISKNRDEIVRDLENLRMAIKDRLTIIKEAENFLAKISPKPKLVEIHYSQRAVMICYGNKTYKPRGDKCKKLIEDLGRHYSSPDEKVRGKPYRVPLDGLDRKKELTKFKNNILHNINRQLSNKGIPLILEMTDSVVRLKTEEDISYH